MSRRGFLRAAAGTAAAMGVSGAAAAQESTASGSGGGGGTQTVQLVDYAFDPGTEEPLVIAPGTTVEFVWDTGGHNIHVDTQPEGAGWTGHESVEDQGFTYTHTFETEGEYHYWCTPHKSLGMIADIQVTPGGASESGGSSEPPIPNQAVTLGIAATTVMLSTLGLAYVFIKYGGDYGQSDSE